MRAARHACLWLARHMRAIYYANIIFTDNIHSARIMSRLPRRHRHHVARYTEFFAICASALVY